jgi:chloramphenicol 3-O-phosphotransferase
MTAARQVIFLYGPPAAGKLTVARALQRLTSVPVFHNHLVVDTLTAVFPFGSPAFVALRERFWLAVFSEAMRADQSLIFTFTPERSVTRAFASEAIRTVEQAGGRIAFVELAVTAAELERRLGEVSRTEHGKLTSVDTFRSLAASGAFDWPHLPEPALRVDTTRVAPEDAARQIAAEFKLGLT